MRPDNAHVVCRDSNFSSRAVENTTQFCSALCTGSKAPLWNGPKAELYLPMQTMKSKCFTQALCQVLCSVHITSDHTDEVFETASLYSWIWALILSSDLLSLPSLAGSVHLSTSAAVSQSLDSSGRGRQASRQVTYPSYL